MKQLWSNATVLWTESEIERRGALIREISALVKETWSALNSAVSFIRVETPILTPAENLQGHLETKFDLLSSGRPGFYLRPETTAGCTAALNILYPQAKQLRKRLPVCVWQAGKSFRNEKHGDTMRATKLRLREFWQLEFELFAPAESRAPYLDSVLSVLINRFGGTTSECPEAELPHYSVRTIDWILDGLEVAGCSVRKDWEHGDLFEISIGLDRLVALLSSNRNR